MDETCDNLLEMIDFTSRVAVKIHAPLPEVEIYRTVCSEFAASKRYSANIVLLDDGGAKVRIGSTCLPPAIVTAAEKAAGLRLDGYRIDLARARSWAKVVREGQTEVVGSRDLLSQWLPGPLVGILLKILGYEGRTSVLVPIKCRGQPVGGLAVSCATFDPRVVPSIEALAAHISSAVTMASAETAHVQLMSCLTASECTLRSLLDAIPESAFLMEPNGTVLAANAATARRLHTTQEELVGTRAYELLPSDVAERRRAYVRQVVSTCRPVYFEDSDRGRRLEHYVYPVMDEVGEVKSLAILGIDVSERFRMHRELALATRLSSVGLLAASLSHRILNPLAVASAAAQLLEGQPDDAELREELTGNIQVAIQRASGVVEDLLKCSTPGPLQLVETRLEAVLAQVLELRGPYLVARGVKVELQMAAELPPVWANQLLLEEVFHTLVLNACDAMASGGLLEISAEGDRDTGVQMSFQDTGPGISAEELSRVFDPFFSTKQQAGHAGLGLFVAQNIVRQHHGTITADSEPGRGTRVAIRLPCTPPDEESMNAS